MKTLLVLLLAIFSCGCVVKYDLVTAARDIPAGAVIKDSDLTTREVKMEWPVVRPHDVVTEDRTRVIGHIAKHEIIQGQIIYLKAIEP